jgi:hypothetical protein
MRTAGSNDRESPERHRDGERFFNIGLARSERGVRSLRGDIEFTCDSPPRHGRWRMPLPD